MRYIVTSKPDVDQNDVVKLFNSLNITIAKNYQHLERHYVVIATDDGVKILKSDPLILSVESAHTIEKLFSRQYMEFTTGPEDYGTFESCWHLARICNVSNPFQSFPKVIPYNYEKTGNGVDVYVIDTGVMPFSCFESVTTIYDAFRDISDINYGVPEHFHGTAVASCIASRIYGVAKRASILALKAFSGTSGTTTSEILTDCINHVIQHHKTKIKLNINKPSILNASFGGPSTVSKEAAFNTAISNGIVLVAAAGNDGVNLDTNNDDFPAEIRQALTIGATDNTDTIASFSNYGSYVDAFAPGVDIIAHYFTDETSLLKVSGTSFSCPITAGTVALFLEGQPIGTDANYVQNAHDWIINNAISRANVSGKPNTTNKLLYTYYTNSSSEDLIKWELHQVNNQPSPAPPYPPSANTNQKYLGTGIAQSIIGFDNPDMILIHNNSLNNENYLFDTTRGPNKFIKINTTDMTYSSDGTVTSFTSSGFTIGSSKIINQLNTQYSSYGWKKYTNFFDIQMYKGTGFPIKVAHTLGRTPELIITMPNTLTGLSKCVYTSLTGPVGSFFLNSSVGFQKSPKFWNNMLPNSAYFIIGNDQNVNKSGGIFCAYLFSSCSGRCKIGMYTGNGQSFGTTITTDFSPNFIMIKPIDGVGDWLVFDPLTNSTNPAIAPWCLNGNNPLPSSEYAININSNGFQIINQNNLNYKNKRYLYFCSV